MRAHTDKSKGPGVYIPPPLFYVLTFLASILLQKKVPIPNAWFQLSLTKLVGVAFIIIALFFLVRSLGQFFRTKNTVVLIKPASSLQTTGVYALTRNPMYLGLALLYLGITCFVGNWWTVILLPILLIIVQEYIIKREEHYLSLEFGAAYEQYKRNTRRWL